MIDSILEALQSFVSVVPKQKLYAFMDQISTPMTLALEDYDFFLSLQ